MMSYRLIVFTYCTLLIFFSAISQTGQKQNKNPLYATNTGYDIHFEFNLINWELTFQWCTPGMIVNINNSGIKASYFSPTKHEIWKGLVKSHTYFTSIYLHKISHFFIETDLIFSYKTIVTISRTLQDEPLLNLRI